VLCDKTAHFREAYYCPPAQGAPMYLLNQLLDMAVKWIDYLGKGEMLTNRDVNTFVLNILEK
jgi:hypothetical protein